MSPALEMLLEHVLDCQASLQQLLRAPWVSLPGAALSATCQQHWVSVLPTPPGMLTMPPCLKVSALEQSW